jgi:hypothetical protein
MLDNFIVYRVHAFAGNGLPSNSESKTRRQGPLGQERSETE